MDPVPSRLAVLALLIAAWTGPASAQDQIAKLLPSNLAPGEELGGAIAMDAD